MTPQAQALLMSQLRIAQRCLVAASSTDKEMLLDDNWQKSMEHVTLMLALNAKRLASVSHDRNQTD